MPTHEFNVGGVARTYISDGLITKGGTSPTLAGTGFGTSPTLALDAGSSSIAGIVNITAGTSPAATGTLTVTFPQSYGTNAPVVVPTLMTGTSSWSATSTVRVAAASTASFQLTWNNVSALTAGSIYKITYHVIGK